MNDNLSRFIDNTVRQFVQKEYTAEEVVRKLKEDVSKLSEYLMYNEPDTQTWREKARRLKEKKEELEEIRKENSTT